MKPETSASVASLAVVLACLLVTACMSTHPQHSSYRLDTTPDDAFTCVLDALGELDYTIRESDRGSGHVVAEGDEVLYNLGLGDELTHPVLTVTVLPSDQGGSRLRVTREGVEEGVVDELRKGCG